MTRVFHAQTLYHILTTSCLESQFNDPHQSHLVVLPNFKNSQEVLEIVRNFGGFDQVHTLMKETSVPRPRKWAHNSISVAKSLYLMHSLSPEELYVCNDRNPIGQALLKMAPDECVCTYVEDGAAAYNSSKFDNKALWKSIFGKIFYGPWLSSRPVIGTADAFDRVAATFPDQLRPEISHYPCLRINKDNLINSSFVNRLAKSYDVERLEELSTLVLPSHSGHISQRGVEALQSLIDSQAQQNEVIGVKYHPRDENDCYLDLPSNATRVPSEIPAEILYLSMKQLNTVVGVLSTALLTARWLSNSMEVLSILDEGEPFDQNLVSMMKSIDIRVVNV